MKKFNIWQAIIFSIIVFLSELHTFFEHSNLTCKCIYLYPFDAPLTVQWVVYQNGEMINWVLFSVFAYRMAKNPTRFSYWLLLLFILWKIVDIPLYWYNYKLFGYGWVYIGLVVVGLLTYKRIVK